jgi:hypothetical protein
MGMKPIISLNQIFLCDIRLRAATGDKMNWGIKMIKILFGLFLLINFSLLSSTDAQWEEDYENNQDDYTYTTSDTEVVHWANVIGGFSWRMSGRKGIKETSDGGYIVTCITGELDDSGDIGIIKLNSSGAIMWQRAYGRRHIEDYPYGGIQETSDGGYIVAGFTMASNYGTHIFWILKLNSSGDYEWQKTYGGEHDMDFPYSIQETTDGGYVVAGTTYSFAVGECDYWILKLTEYGDIEWQRTYGGSGYDRAIHIQQTTDGGYVVAGVAESFRAGSGYKWRGDYWILKLTENGDIEWQKTYGGGDFDRANSIHQTADGGYIISGRTGHWPARKSDFWILKLSSSGDIEWQRAYGYGGATWETAGPIIPTSDGGYIIGGSTEPYGDREQVGLILKLTSNGDIKWQRTYGQTGSDDGTFNIQETSDGRYIVLGDMLFTSGNHDLMILKLSRDGNIGPSCEIRGRSDAIVTDTNVSPSDTNVIPVDTNVTPKSTYIEPQKTNASTNIICTWSGFIPATPKSLKAIPISWNKIKLEWIDKSTIEKGFRIERKKGKGEWEEIKKAKANKIQYRDKGLEANKLYKYRIRALNKNGYSAYSNTAKARTKKK